MNILTVCDGGNTRSVCAALLLKDSYGERDVLAMGIGYTSEKTAKMLLDWADCIIVVAELRVRNLVPRQYTNKVIWIEMEPDHWFNPFDSQLMLRMNKALVPILNKIRGA